VVVTGFPKQFSGSTDSSGQISFPWRINGNSVTGKFTVAAQASKDGYSPASGSASFLTRCPPSPPAPSPHGGNNDVAGLSPILQFQKYFKEFTDMPANSSLYITTTSMHKDTLGDIVITGEIKNNGTNTANFVELIATFYDTSNQTLGNKNTFTEPTTLQPKQAAPFTMYVSPTDMPLNRIDHVKYHLDWQNGSGSANKELPKTGSLKTASGSESSLTPTLSIIGNISKSTGILLLNGQNDSQTPVQQTFLLQQRLTDVNHPDHTLITYPNLGHYFYPSPHWFTETGPFEPYVLADLYSWLESHSGFTRTPSVMPSFYSSSSSSSSTNSPTK
jgi:Prolyl oligopeptidase family